MEDLEAAEEDCHKEFDGLAMVGMFLCQRGKYEKSVDLDA